MVVPSRLAGGPMRDGFQGRRGLIARFLRDRSGATAIEYGLICLLIFLAVVGALRATATR